MKTVLVTGGTGFLGSWLTLELRKRHYRVITVNSADFDLRNWVDAVDMFDQVNADLEGHCPDFVIHAAANVGGILYNTNHQSAILHDNLLMTLNMLEACSMYPLEKLVLVGSVCAYPSDCPIPFREGDIWAGKPEQSNLAYGISKRVQMEAGIRYHEEHFVNVVNVVPTNFYGPGDNFDPRFSHVIPAMIRKFDRCLLSGEEVVLWGDGTPTRDFLYVSDVARGIVQAMEKVVDPQPINLGSGQEISMRDLAEKIMIATKCVHCEITWTGEKNLNGQARRVLDVSRATELLGFKPGYSLDEGLKHTVSHYRNIRP